MNEIEMTGPEVTSKGTKLSDIYGASDFLKAPDLNGERPVVTITDASVRESQFDNGDHKTQICLELKEFSGKAFPLNITNARRISDLLRTENYEKWVGSKVRLMTEPTKTPEGRLVDAIRVHPDLPEQDIPF